MIFQEIQELRLIYTRKMKITSRESRERLLWGMLAGKDKKGRIERLKIGRIKKDLLSKRGKNTQRIM